MNGLADPVADPLAQLRDIPLPADPGWWPPAPGWWLLFIVLVTGAVLAVWFGLPRVRRFWQSRCILRELERQLELVHPGDSGQEQVQALGRLSRLVRQYAVSRFGRRRVGALSGDDWLAFLDRTSGTAEFTRGAGSLLAEGPYRPASDALDPSHMASIRQSILTWARACHRKRGSLS